MVIIQKKNILLYDHTLGIIGHFIVANEQIHNYQIEYLNEYLEQIELKSQHHIIEDILDGKDGSITYEQAKQSLLEEDIAVQKDIIKLLFVLAYADNVLDVAEERFINIIVNQLPIHIDEIELMKQEAYTYTSTQNKDKAIIFQRPELNSNIVYMSVLQRIKIYIKRIWQHISGASKRKAKKREEEANKYKAMIEECKKIAISDFDCIKPVYEKICDAISMNLDNMDFNTGIWEDQSEETIQMKNSLCTFKSNIEFNISKKLDELHQQLERKERAISDFTISLIGRTKAGKTTLHSILTQEGVDKIGVGKQRTTRYNRVYQWNLLKLIDTPGIGSAEAAGRTDDEIAESVLGESDVLCFVVVDDSILQDIFDFIEKAVTLNKPIIVVLNHKENIRSKIKFKYFLKNPKNWLDDKGEGNLLGYINRINNYAKDKSFDAQIHVIPVFLLAAQMANEQEHYKHQEILWNNSNMDTLIETINDIVINGGSIRKSQTFLDETVHQLTNVSTNLYQEVEPLLKQVILIEEQINKQANKHQELKIRTLCKVDEIIECNMNEFISTYLRTFVENVYNENSIKEKDIENLINEKKLNENINDEIEKQIGILQEEIRKDTCYLIEKIDFHNYKSLDISKVKFFNFKNLTNALSILSSLSRTASYLPVLAQYTGVLVVLGGVLNFSASLINDDNKRLEKIDKIYEILKDELLKTKIQMQESYHNELGMNIENVLERRRELIYDIVSTTNEIIDETLQITDIIKHESELINKIYAWRILQFLEGKGDEYDYNNVLETIEEVTRSKQEIHIKCSTSTKVYNTGRLKGIITESVVIE